MKVKRYKSTRKYRCPYCRVTATRDRLISHIQDHHEDMLPEGYSAARVLYEHINKKNYGTCIICKKPVYEWDETICRYKNLCDNPHCMAQLKARSAKNHLEDPEVQKKLLAGRRISGNYTFADRTVHSYVGSYERNCFEFMDKVLNIQGKDIMSPGPTVYYEWNGEKHPWILDWMYIPAMLCADVKDGGSNPNNRPMEDYRERQIAKEEAIAKEGKYNYIRLTDNNFAQLLEALANIRQGTINHDPLNHIFINESTSINEGKVLSTKDLTFNTKDWRPGGKNILFVVGLSGSGKSTVARAIGSDFAAIYIELDRFNHFKRKDGARKNRPDEQLIADFIVKEKINKDPGDMPDEEYDKYLLKFIDYVKKVADKNKEELYILEGIQIIKYAKHNSWIFKYPMIIKGTSMLKSILNRFKRSKDYDNYEMYDGADMKDNRSIFNLLDWYLDQEYSLNCLRDAAKKINETSYYTRPDKEIERYLPPEDDGDDDQQLKGTIYPDTYSPGIDHSVSASQFNYEAVGGMPSNRAHNDYIVPHMMNGLVFDGGDRSGMYFGNTGWDKLIHFDAEENPHWEDKQLALMPLIEDYKLIFNNSNILPKLSDSEISSLGEDGLISKMMGRPYNGLKDLIMSEGIVSISSDTDNDIARALVTNGIVSNIKHVISEMSKIPLKEEFIESKGNVMIYKDDEGYYLTTPDDFLLTSNHYPSYTDIPEDMIKTMDDMYKNRKREDPNE